MTREHTISRYRRVYRTLLSLYPKRHRDRFAEGMEQTFADLCRDRPANRNLHAFALSMFVDAGASLLREHSRDATTRRAILRIAIGTACVLLVPLVGNLFMGWRWPAFAFVVWGILLFGAGSAFEVIARMGNTMTYRTYRAAVALACLTGLALLFITAAAGIIGDGPINLLYLGVLAVPIIGAALARFRPSGMALALLATAAAQMLVPVIALVIWKTAGPRLLTDGASPHPPFHPGILPVFGLNAVFAALWLVSAFLFRRAGDRRPSLQDHPGRGITPDAA